MREPSSCGTCRRVKAQLRKPAASCSHVSAPSKLQLQTATVIHQDEKGLLPTPVKAETTCTTHRHVGSSLLAAEIAVSPPGSRLVSTANPAAEEGRTGEWQQEDETIGGANTLFVGWRGGSTRVVELLHANLRKSRSS